MISMRMSSEMFKLLRWADRRTHFKLDAHDLAMELSYRIEIPPRYRVAIQKFRRKCRDDRVSLALSYMAEAPEPT